MLTNMKHIDHLEGISESIGNDIVRMVFGKVNNLDEDLAQFTTGEERQNVNRLVWKDGNSRYPHINRVSGMVGLYENPEVNDLAMSSEIIRIFQDLYPNQNEVIYAHGPPIPIVKPLNSGKSSGIIFTMQDTSPGIKYSGILALTNHQNEKTGELEKLQNFDIYYDLLDAFYDFSEHSKGNDVIYLDWEHQSKNRFNITDANAIIEEYTSLYNFHVRGIQCTLCREIRWEVARVFEGGRGIYGKPKRTKTSERIDVPEKMLPLSWEKIRMNRGDLYIISSKDVIRTLQNDSKETRIYLHFAMEPKPENWDNSEQKQNLKLGYKTGKFGNWGKPGLRFYLRENSTENRWRRGEGKKDYVDILNLPPDKKKIFGIS
jgi:hypothetical protein